MLAALQTFSCAARGDGLGRPSETEALWASSGAAGARGKATGVACEGLDLLKLND
jgi:hypothetical protein